MAGVLRSGKYCSGKVEVVDHAAGNVLVVGDSKYLVTQAGAVLEYNEADDAATPEGKERLSKRREEQVERTKVPVPPSQGSVSGRKG